jgi:ankyrin repeat protein
MASLFWFLGEGLRDAIKDNALDGVKQVLNKDKTLVNYVDRQSQSMLHVAVIFNQTETVLELIARGVDIEAKNGEGQTALQLAQDEYPALAMRMKTKIES